MYETKNKSVLWLTFRNLLFASVVANTDLDSANTDMAVQLAYTVAQIVASYSLYSQMEFRAPAVAVIRLLENYIFREREKKTQLYDEIKIMVLIKVEFQEKR